MFPNLGSQGADVRQLSFARGSETQGLKHSPRLPGGAASSRHATPAYHLDTPSRNRCFIGSAGRDENTAPLGTAINPAFAVLAGVPFRLSDSSPGQSSTGHNEAAYGAVQC